MVDNDKIGRCMGECDVMAEEALMVGKVNRNDLLMIARELREEGLSVMGGRNTQYADADFLPQLPRSSGDGWYLN